MPAHSPHRFHARLVWTGAARGPTRTYDAYSRDWAVDIVGKPTIHGSAAGPFRGDESMHNPEDLLMAALSACHCLSYLALCAKYGIHVLSYEDAADGTMERVECVTRFTEVVLHPRVVIAKGHDLARATALHHDAHAGCFIASSVNFPVRNEPEVVESA
jgi:organic hydroperoxide reductase OsmC/OhrA